MSENAENWVAVAEASSLEPGTVLGVKAGDVDVALYNIDGELYATHNVCTHALVLLSDGWLEGNVIECPLHGGRFEVKSGKGLGAPITCDIKIYPVRISGNSVEVNLNA